MPPRRIGKHELTRHSSTAHNAGCRCASCKLKFADFEGEAHLPRYQEPTAQLHDATKL